MLAMCHIINVSSQFYFCTTEPANISALTGLTQSGQANEALTKYLLNPNSTNWEVGQRESTNIMENDLITRLLIFLQSVILRSSSLKLLL